MITESLGLQVAGFLRLVSDHGIASRTEAAELLDKLGRAMQDGPEPKQNVPILFDWDFAQQLGEYDPETREVTAPPRTLQFDQLIQMTSGVRVLEKEFTEDGKEYVTKAVLLSFGVPQQWDALTREEWAEVVKAVEAQGSQLREWGEWLSAQRVDALAKRVAHRLFGRPLDGGLDNRDGTV